MPEKQGSFIFGGPFSRSQAATNRIVAAANPISGTITLQGDGVLTDHFFAVAQVMIEAMPEIVAHMGLLMIDFAREIHYPHIRTQETYDSIGPSEKGLYTTAPGVWNVDIGPETLQGRLLEFGFLHVRSGRFIQYPFMIPAANIVAPIFFEAATKLAEVTAFRRSLPAAVAGSAAAETVARFRGQLYAFSKLAGDLKVFGFGGLAGLRTGALRTARGLGDVESGFRGAIGTRIVHRASGRWVSGALTAQRTAVISGPSTGFNASAQRIYNRVSGNVIGNRLGSL
jgi:hypothetical protein